MNATEAWQRGKSDEIQFWRDVFGGGRFPDYQREMMTRLDPATPLTRWISCKLRRGVVVSELRILDVAAGPVSCVGWHVDGMRPQITAIDALADEYRSLLDGFGLVPPVYTQRCDAEGVGDKFGDGVFDVVHIRNGLDHCYDAPAAVQAMWRVLKRGGLLFIHGFVNEAEVGHYEGLHQWNVCADDGELTVWRPEVRWRARDLLEPGAATADVQQSDEARWVSAVLRKGK